MVLVGGRVVAPTVVVVVARVVVVIDGCDHVGVGKVTVGRVGAGGNVCCVVVVVRGWVVVVGRAVVGAAVVDGALVIPRVVGDGVEVVSSGTVESSPSNAASLV